jgi:hypothetical protein
VPLVYYFRPPERDDDIMSIDIISQVSYIRLMKTGRLLPACVSTAVAGRLLGFVPPSAINHYRAQHPDEFRNSTVRRIAMIDIDRNPRRRGKLVSVEELLAADRACDTDRARYRHYNATRRDAAHA